MNKNDTLVYPGCIPAGYYSSSVMRPVPSRWTPETEPQIVLGTDEEMQQRLDENSRRSAEQLLACAGPEGVRYLFARRDEILARHRNLS